MFFRVIVKSAVTGGSMYYSKQLGVWGDSNKSTILCEEISNQLRPHVRSLKNQIPLELPYLPSSGEIGHLIKYYYNNSVKSSIHFVEMLPCYVGQWSRKGYDSVQDALNAVQPTAVEVVKQK